MRYRLFYGSIELGDVTEEDGDFPKIFGRFRPNPQPDPSDLRAHIERYRAYSEAADRLMAEGSEEDWEQFVADHES